MENWKEGRETVFFTAVGPMNEPRRDEPYDVREHERYRTRRHGKCIRMQFIGST